MAKLKVYSYQVGPVCTNCYFAANTETKETIIIDPGAAADYLIEQIEKEGNFAEGCGFYKLFWLFLIGAVLGDFTETIFCRLTAGVWMSRSSLVWGPFSIVSVSYTHLTLPTIA